MKIVRLIIGILTALIVLTTVVEGIEFLIVKLTSGHSAEYLSTNQSEYFELRNQAWVLVLKVLYTLLAAFLAGWLGSRITQHLHSSFLVTVVVIQCLAFFYAMFFSEYKDTLPMYYWGLLLAVVVTGVYTGHRMNRKMLHSTSGKKS